MVTLKRTLLGALMPLFMGFSLNVGATEPSIGYVMKVTGDASVSINGTLQTATVGMPVYVGSVVKTGGNGSLGVTLSDSTLLSFGPNSELSLDAFMFEPAENNLKLSAKISHGTLDYVSGVIAHLKPEAVEINTPTGTIGVRGTHFLVKVDG